MRYFKLVQYDLDGTLIDTFMPLVRLDIKVIQEFTGKLFSEEEYLKIFNPGANWLDHYREFGISKQKDQEAALRRFSKLEETLSPVNTTDGAIEFVNYIKDCGIPQHIITRHDNLVIVDNKLKQSGLDKYFSREQVTITDHDKTEKIQKVCDSYNVSKGQTLFITDTASDVICGNNAGVLTVAIAGPASYHKEEKLASAKPWQLFKGIKHVQELFLYYE